MSGPYFSGQQACECGHYYPDVLRLRDEKKRDGKFVRVMDCVYCGKYELPLDIQGLAKPFRDKLLKKGVDVGIRDEDIKRARQKNIDILLASKKQDLSDAFIELDRILSEAIAGKAKSVEIEHVNDGLEITFMFGVSGLGMVVEDKRLADEIIDILVEKAELQKKQRGRMKWDVDGRMYWIEVEEYENFGESAFRLSLAVGKRKRH